MRNLSLATRTSGRRTAIAKSNILVNKAEETRYFYQDLDADGKRLNGANRYTVTFPKNATTRRPVICTK